MTQPVQNLCSPANIYGGFQQTLFLGCSISSFSASAGFNEQVSEVTIQIVQDLCASPEGTSKLYYDTLLEPQQWTDADPGFYGLTLPIIGAPVYFRVGDFEFSGIVQNWEQSNTESGSPIFTVKLVDPRQILENAELIINDYAGAVASVPNLINVFGFLESFGGNCDQMYQSAPGTYAAGSGGVDGAVFGSPAEAYGGADTNNNGTQWNQILTATRLLLCTLPPVSNDWSPFGRLLFKAPTNIEDGMGLMSADDIYGRAYYLVDLNEAPNAPDYWRLQGTNVSLMDAISSVCQDAGMDYYVELVPVLISGVIMKFIKVRTVDRTASPALNNIEAFVEAPARNGFVTSYNRGRELRNEPTSSFVIGGQKQSFYQAYQNYDPEGDGQSTPPEKDDMIVPYFGVNPDTGNVIVPYKDADDYWEFTAPSKDLVQTLSFYGVGTMPNSLLITEKELICASVSYDLWISYAAAEGTELYDGSGLTVDGLFHRAELAALVNQVQAAGNKMRPSDFLTLRNSAFKGHESKEVEIAQACYNWIKKFADEYYGKKFQVRVPWVCGRRDSESDIILKSEEPSDGGWTEVSTVLGLANPGILSDFFRLEDNRLGAFCVLDTADTKELAELSPEEFVVDIASNNLFLKVDVESDYVYIDKDSLFSPRAVISLSTPVRLLETDDQPVNFKAIAKLLEFIGAVPAADAKAVAQDSQHNVGSMYMNVFWPNRPYMPYGVGFGIKSNVLTYGPWGSVGPAGGVTVTKDDGLVPWEYGGFTTMDAAGNSIASEGVTATQVAEGGSITVAGYPDLPLGAELLAADAGGPFAGGVGTNLIENRTVDIDILLGATWGSVGMFPWDGTYGPNITGISTQVGAGGITTTYTMRTWTPKFGRFQKGNAERLKKIGQQRLAFQKKLRAKAFQAIKFNTLKNLGRQITEYNAARNGHIAGPKNSPHAVFVGQIATWDDTIKRPFVESYSMNEIGAELVTDEGYSEKAIMSLDGLIRPIATAPTDTLPGFATPQSPCQSTASRGSQPPVGESAEYYNLPIKLQHLNPFVNPNTAVSNRSDTPEIGHDIEVLARTAEADKHLTIPIAGFDLNEDFAESDYADEYRGFALRGPLVLTGWGYDLDGFPVPNLNDTNAESGVFTDGAVTHKFKDGWLRNPKSWPTAPIDLRFDRQRGVWTIPQFRDVKAIVQECVLPSSSGSAFLLPDYSIYDGDGTEITTPQIVVHDYVGNTVSSGTTVIARYNPATCQYYIIDSQQLMVRQNECPPITTQAIPTGENFSPGRSILGPGLLAEKHIEGSGNACDVYFTAGIIPSSIAGCVPTGEVDSTGNRVYSKILFGRGLNIKNGDAWCELEVGTNFSLENDQTYCIDTDVIESVLPECFNKLIATKGIVFEDQGDGVAKVGAGFGIDNDELCVAGGDTDIGLFTRLIAGKGLIIENAESGGVCGDARIGLYLGIDSFYAAKIALGTGLTATNDAETCTVTIHATGSGGFAIANDDDCVTVGDNETGPFNKLIAGRGTIIEDAGAGQARIGLHMYVDSYPVAGIILGSGLVAEDTGSCNVTIHATGGGLREIRNDGYCVTEGDDVVGQFDELIAGRGLLIEQGGGAGEARIGLNLRVNAESPTGATFYGAELSIVGLHVTGDETDPCHIHIDNRGLSVINQDICVKDETGGVGYIRNYGLIGGKGVIINPSDDPIYPGYAEVGAGLAIANDTSCVTAGDDIDPRSGSTEGLFSKLIAGKGLLIEKSADCEARIGLNAKVNSYQATEINFSDCFDVTDNEDCTVAVDFAHKFAGTSPLDVLTGLVSFSLSGTNIEIVFSKSRIDISSCGTITNITPLENVTGTIEGSECTVPE